MTADRMSAYQDIEGFRCYAPKAALDCADYPGFAEVVQAYLDTLDGRAPRHAAVAMANPVEGDAVRMTNRDWAFSITSFGSLTNSRASPARLAASVNLTEKNRSLTTARTRFGSGIEVCCRSITPNQELLGGNDLILP